MAPMEIPSTSVNFVFHSPSSTSTARVPTHPSLFTIQPSVSAGALSLPLTILLPTIGYPGTTRAPSNDDQPDAPTSLTTLALIITGIALLVLATGCYRLRQMRRLDRTDMGLIHCQEHDTIHSTTTTTTTTITTIAPSFPCAPQQPAAVFSREDPLSLLSENLDRGPARGNEAPPPPYERRSRS